MVNKNQSIYVLGVALNSEKLYKLGLTIILDGNCILTGNLKS